jgi:CspA family cold shock protein
MTIGWVKFFSATKGFGFLIDTETNNDIFVHYSSIVRMTPGYKSLKKGEYVEFEHVDSDQGPAAFNVKGLNGGPLLCEAYDVHTTNFGESLA